MPVMAVPPPAACHDCGRTWNSATLVDGLRLLGTCPRCGGELTFRDAAADQADPATTPEGQRTVAPHLVLGIPRR